MTARVATGRVRVLGTGHALPGPPVSSEELLTRLEANFGVSVRTGMALARRLGVASRHICRDFAARFESPRAGNRNPELAAAAVADALAQAKVPVAHLQYLIGHTTTPARLLPPNIAEVADRLSHAGPYSELRQACTGFANALQWATGLLAAPAATPIAIVGSETGSVYFDALALADDPGQWVNLMQMGDGAGAIVLAPDDGTPGARLESAFFGHIGLGKRPGFSLDEGGSDFPAVRADRSVVTFRHDYEAVKRDGAELFDAGLKAARDAGVDVAALAAIVPHQANGKIGDWLARRFGLTKNLFYGNAERVGNLGSAAIWVALDDLRSSGRLNHGDHVLVLGAEATQYLYGGFVYVHG
jgi:3-oxoacyl-[acyl-carrier-protein] synthase-3